jgi:hypothetical protein
MVRSNLELVSSLLQASSDFSDEQEENLLLLAAVPPMYHPNEKCGDKNVKILELLLKVINPHVCDARGFYLDECLYLQSFFKNQDKITESAISGRCMQWYHESDRQQAMILLQNARNDWTPARHCFYSDEFKKQVFMLLLCNRRNRNLSKPFLQRDVLYLVIREWCKLQSELGFHQKLCANFSLMELKTLTNAITPATPPYLKKMHANILVDDKNVISAKHAKFELAHGALPDVIGEVIMVTNFSDQQHKEIQHFPVYNPTRQRNFTIGRNHSSIRFTLNISLKEKYFSRLHMSIRYNWGRWEFRIAGKLPVWVSRRGNLSDYKAASTGASEIWHMFDPKHTTFILRTQTDGSANEYHLTLQSQALHNPGA